ncbi:MAG: NAD(P)-binding domain-containing protein [Fibrobacteria bacterium]|nr:NAD(P)-binding domain-containing protein [Fibrobacteria bacterium]
MGVLNAVTRFLIAEDGQRPLVKKNHESSRSGIFLAGDLAGTPTLKTSIKDGYQALRSAEQWLKTKTQSSEDIDVVICGSGPAGLAAALEAKIKGLKYVVLEKNAFANTIKSFPLGKKIWARSEQVNLESALWLDNCTREELLEKWSILAKEENLTIEYGQELKGVLETKTGFKIQTTSGTEFSCGAIIIATGKRGNPRKLNIPGEDLDHVKHLLLDPHGYQEKDVMVVGGGNSAVEAANTLAANNARVSISYRQDSFFRVTPENKKEIEANIQKGSIKAYYKTSPTFISDTHVTLHSGKDSFQITSKQVFVLVGAEPPKALLNRVGVRFENQWSARRVLGLLSVTALVWMFYAFFKWGGGDSLNEFPFSLLGKSWEVLPSWLVPGIVKGALYTALVIVFGIPALKRWRRYPRIKNYQTAHFLVIFFSQAFLLFIIPEFIISIIDPGNYWRFYGIILPFPLLYEIFFYSPPVLWLILCAVAAFVVIPIFVYWHGKRFCSWVCGCGCLAETMGDPFRHYAPKGNGSRRIEKPVMRVILVLAVVSALAYFLLQGGKGPGPWYVKTYVYMVDFWLASVIGVGTYFFFGGRIWCRYLCPLAHYMRVLSAWYSKFRIKPAERCIGCGECSRYCQMGIEVMKFALKGESVNNKNSSCIGCGVCVSVCPMDNLTMGKKFPNEENYIKEK